MLGMKMAVRWLICTAFAILYAYQPVAAQSHYNPTILQDSRDEPKTDGRFGFLYRTEDGIAHAAKSEGDGLVHGRYTYTDSTGFKLNFNYNAGTRVTPGYNYDAGSQQATYNDNYDNQQLAPAPAPTPAPQARQQYYREPLYDNSNVGYDHNQNQNTIHSRPPHLRNSGILR